MKFKTALIPYAVWIIIFTVVPLLLVGYFAFTNDANQFTFENIAQVSKYTNVFIRSIFLAMVATAVCLLIAYPLAFIISRKSASKQRLMIMLIMLPMWMNFLLRTYAWMSLIENKGIINQILGIFGMGPFQMINTPGAVVLGMVYNYVPFMLLPLFSIMTKIDKRIIDAAQDLGANTYHIFSKIVLPLSIPGIISGVIMVFVPSVSTFIISRMLGGGSNLLIGDLIELQFLGNAYNPNLGSAISLVLMVIILLCMLFLNVLDDEQKEDMLI